MARPKYFTGLILFDALCVEIFESLTLFSHSAACLQKVLSSLSSSLLQSLGHKLVFQEALWVHATLRHSFLNLADSRNDDLNWLRLNPWEWSATLSRCSGRLPPSSFA
ncbi:hypothetical protein K438DRAFT_925251 [Mycena galopus ATCC 62051]|nr:hypothetical protein K438DRAFT_925251 [Mycena galopus ATCC 62051]